VSIGLAVADEAGAGPAAPPRIKIRIESLSDLVFGLALSIGSLILIGRVPQSGQELAVNVVLFGFSFAIVVLVWLGYSRTMAVLPVESSFALLANIVLLFLVALEPYLFYVLQSVSSAGLVNSASTAYALDAGGMFFMQALLAYLVVKEEKGELRGRRPSHPVVVARFWRFAKIDAAIGLLFVISALPFFWSETPIGFLRFYLWSSSFFIFIVGYPFRRSRGRQA
jgi:uncharacterized membrane protein